MNEVKGNGETVIGKIRRGDDSFLRFTVKEINGTRYLDMRIFCVNSMGKDYPTPRGLSLTKQSLLKAKQHIDTALKMMNGEDLS